MVTFLPQLISHVNTNGCKTTDKKYFIHWTVNDPKQINVGAEKRTENYSATLAMCPWTDIF